MQDSERKRIDSFFQTLTYVIGPPIAFVAGWGIFNLLFGDTVAPVAWGSGTALLFLLEQPLEDLSVRPAVHPPTTKTKAVIRLVSIVAYGILFAVVLGFSIQHYMEPPVAATGSAIFLLIILAKAIKHYLACPWPPSEEASESR